ncbi:MAG TPA: hypothetical protein QGF43_04830 [Acidimicrobiales bacterium]|nr:hypothetical protein [Acidimicrobiales bacterium]MDP6281782.1 hypothetical protein [Acidimicrobiales bacterium]MDP7117176.1 hypothetical protein [Acidimicrobiales bacterium]MDP7410773.1 hypothetical protein [Acidimicrobiales bacterium]MEE1521906.1 hypothetical protein [Acidimicrobiales bacterium]
MSNPELDLDAMLARFRERAEAVRSRNMPPIGGEERQRFLDQAQADFMDFAIIGDANASIEDGVLTLRVDLSSSDGD